MIVSSKDILPLGTVLYHAVVTDVDDTPHRQPAYVWREATPDEWVAYARESGSPHTVAELRWQAAQMVNIGAKFYHILID